MPRLTEPEYDFKQSNGCYVFDIDESHTRRRILSPCGGQLNEDGSFLLTDLLCPALL